MITEDYVSFEIAKLLKDRGFNEKCSQWYVANEPQEGLVVSGFGKNQFYVNAPTHQMAMKWLREEKGTSIIIEFDVTKGGYCPYVHQLDYDMDWVVKWAINIPMKYEEAVEAALKYSLENLI